jgi:phage tail protein X
MSLRRVKFLRQCAGLPAEPSPRTRPSVLLVNRPYADGRSILGLDDVADRVRRALPPDVPVRLYLPRGDAGIADQATAFDEATVVVAPHGAATANFNFLPHDAVALGVFALKGRFGHDEAVGVSMPAPPYNITVLPVDCTQRTEARTLAVANVPQFSALPAEDQLALLMGAEMSRERSTQVHKLMDMSLLDWMDYRAYAPDPAELTEAILDAVELWRAKVMARERRRGAEGEEDPAWTGGGVR